MKCMKRGWMNVNNAGHLLVITHCTTGKHPKQLIVYANNQHVLHQITLPDGMGDPISAVNSAENMFVVVGFVPKGKVWWIDQHGRVLGQYGQQAGEELSCPCHIMQHSKGPLLITDKNNHRVVLLSNEATLLQHLTDVRYPLSLHLDEQAGLLSVGQWENENSVHVKVFQFWIKPTRKLCLKVGM